MLPVCTTSTQVRIHIMIDKLFLLLRLTKLSVCVFSFKERKIGTKVNLLCTNRNVFKRLRKTWRERERRSRKRKNVSLTNVDAANEWEWMRSHSLTSFWFQAMWCDSIRIKCYFSIRWNYWMSWFLIQTWDDQISVRQKGRNKFNP